MHTISDLQRSLGESRAQIRWKLGALARIDGLLDKQVHTGRKGRKEYSPAVLEMLRELEALASNSSQSVEEAAQELGKRVVGEREKTDAKQASMDNQLSALTVFGIENPLLALVLEEKEKRLGEKDDRIAQLEGEVKYLRERVEELMPLALAPPRKTWLGWLRRSRKNG